MAEEKKDKKDSFEKVSKERDEYLDGWKRAKADLINYKKEEVQRLDEIARFASKEIVLDLIKVIDSFELALAALEKEGSVEKGVYMIKGQLMEVLEKYGVQTIEIGEGDQFDPSIHEAIANVETEDDKDDQIAEEVEKGYIMHDKVIRAAKVKVYKEK